MDVTTRETHRLRILRNLSPHKEAIAAMFIWGRRYSEQGGGSMDFWDSLSWSDKETCRRLVDRIEDAPERATVHG